MFFKIGVLKIFKNVFLIQHLRWPPLFVIPDFKVSTAILNKIDISLR